MPKAILKRSKRKHKLSFIIFIIVTGIFLSYQLIEFLNNKANPIFMSYADAETKKLMTLIINRAVTKQVANNMDTNSLFKIIQNDKGEIQLIDFNSINVTKVLNTITDLVQQNLKALEEGNIELLKLSKTDLINYDLKKLKKGIIYEIPIGVISGNTFLSNLGPKIPVKLNVIGDVISGVETDVTPYGINNALIKISVKIEVSSKINLPFISKKVMVSNTIPIAMKIIQGQIPNYLLGGFKDYSILNSTS